MCPKCDKQCHNDCREATSTSEKDENADGSCILKYSRSPRLSTVSATSESFVPRFVYSRKKFRGNSASLSDHVPTSTKRSGEDCLSIISSDSHSLAINKRYILPENMHETETVGCAFISHLGSERKPPRLKPESINRYSFVEDLGSDDVSKRCRAKIVDVDSINDSCSSSKSNMELISASVNTEVDDAGECSSSGVLIEEVMGAGLSENDTSVSTLKSKSVLAGVLPGMNSASDCGVGDNGDSSSTRVCKMCSRAGSTLKMLICDNCEEAFHVSCCNPRVKKIPLDEWFCESCLKKKHKILNETISRRSSNMIGELVRSRNVSSTGESNPIASMLKDTEPYKSGVRVGKGFQAQVPEWPAPINSDADINGEPLEMDPSESVSLHSKHSLPGSIGNWLQCKAIIDDATEGSNVAICGKWRRAPLSEVQTDDWECFCSVLWDPIHADCAVPQELETDQILKQLKYVQMVRPRIAAKRRRMDPAK
ncbi:hypothetical protein Tsubulata_016056 [Turnera subulata]|uniref:PHD-type domain-containing protein n=1 Tax=Turnera subulata TaxID=218843 RepID=A0A9Q0FKJ2_9ROSI|nr:hypothetical protein Tsubulata_016056 [Turnera subulata]